MSGNGKKVRTTRKKVKAEGKLDEISSERLFAPPPYSRIVVICLVVALLAVAITERGAWNVRKGGISTKDDDNGGPGPDINGTNMSNATWFSPYRLGFNGTLANFSVHEQVDFGYRIPNTTGSLNCTLWIADLLEQYGFNVSWQNFTGDYGVGDGVNFSNVIGRLEPPPGTGNFTPGSNDTILLLGAHYDTRPFADMDTSENQSKPIDGANDGGSGVAVLLELARILALEGNFSDGGVMADINGTSPLDPFFPLNVTIELVFFDGEDYGKGAENMFYGSNHFADLVTEHNRSGEYIGAVIVDMIGDADLQIYKERNSDISAPWLNDMVWEIAEKLGHNASFINRTKWAVIDDHIPLALAGIPSIDIIDIEYRFWHTIRDTIDKVSAESLGQVGEVVESLVYYISDMVPKVVEKP